MEKTSTHSVNKMSSNFGAKGWVIIILSFLCIMVQSSIINDSMNTVIGEFSMQHGWSEEMLRMFSTICSILSVFGAAIWGTLSSKTSVRLSWGVSLGVTAVACIFWGNAGNSTIYFICLAVASIGGMGFAYIANLNVISNWFPNKKGLAMGWVTIGFPLSASLTTPIVTALLGNSGGLANVYYFYAIVVAILFVLVLVLVRDYPEQAGAFPDNDRNINSEEQKRKLAAGMDYMKTSPWKAGRLFKTPLVWKMGFSLGVMELLSLGIMTNYVPRCISAFMESKISELMATGQFASAEEAAAAASGLIVSEIAVPMLAVAGIIACFGSFLCGILDAKVGPKKATIITLIIGIIAILLNITNIIPVMYVSLFFLGFMLGGASNYLVSLTNTVWGRYDFPMAYKVLKPIVAIIGAFGISVVGIVGAQVNYTVAYLVLAVLAALSLIVMLTISEKRIGKADD